MEEFLNNLRQDPPLFYFLIIFALIWGGGMLWGVITVIRHLGKKTESVSSLKRLGFTPVKNNMGIMLQIKDILMKTLWHDFSLRVDEHPRQEFLKTAINNGKISITYEIPRQEYHKLPRATGIKEKIQVIKREMVLNNILYKTIDGSAFYAQTKDTEKIRSYKPRTRVQCTTGWVICLAGRNIHPQFTIYKKFTGHRKLLMNMAFKMAQIKPAGREGLLPEFNEEFEVLSANIPNSQPILGKNLQRQIIKYKKHMIEGLKLFVNSEGIWMTSEEWLNKRQTEQMVSLCGEILLELKK